MDAKITKQRLSNLLSYDWLRILVAVVVAVTALSVFFSMIKPSPRDEQIFTIYTYSDLISGEDGADLGEAMLEGKVFSYDILDVQYENLVAESSSSIFGGGAYNDAIYTTRLLNDSRTVMFVTGVDEEESEGRNALLPLVSVGDGDENGFLEVDEYLAECEEYLTDFFGASWEEGELNEERAAERFLSRNRKDNRYRSAEKRAAGIEEEKARLEALRRDYSFVKREFAEGGRLYYTYFTPEEGETFCCGIGMGRLNGFHKLFYYQQDENGSKVNATSRISMILFNSYVLNNRDNDLRYETVSFLRYLVERYGD